MNRRVKFMENQLAEIYGDLADRIIDAIPDEWEKLYYLGEVENGRSSWSSVFYFFDDDRIIRSHNIPEVYGVSRDIYMELLDAIDAMLLKLYDCFIENGKEAWDQVSLTIYDTGKFNIDYKYDVIEKTNGGQVKREVIWAFETIGIIPEENSFQRTLYEEYLKEKNNS